MNDLISRRAAIDALDKHLRTTDVPASYPGIISALTEWMEELPSAQRTGKWIDGRCNRCDNHAPFWSMATTYYESNFCPNCGAKMVGGDVDEAD